MALVGQGEGTSAEHAALRHERIDIPGPRLASQCLRLWEPPTPVSGWFALYQASTLGPNKITQGDKDMGREYFKGEVEEGRAYSPAVNVTGGTTVYLAGVGMATDEGGNSLAGNFEAQVRASFERIRQNLRT